MAEEFKGHGWIPPKKNKNTKRSLFVILYRGFWFGVLPLFTVYVAAFIAYVNSTPIPAGTIFRLMGQPMMWMSTATPAVRLIDDYAHDCAARRLLLRLLRLRLLSCARQPLVTCRVAQVPANMAAAAGPANQLFADLPGGSKMPMTGLGMCCRGTAYHDESVRRSVLW